MARARKICIACSATFTASGDARELLCRRCRRQRPRWRTSRDARVKRARAHRELVEGTS